MSNISPANSRANLSVRFAPSPTGTFHVGNLRTAWISWEVSRFLGAQWVLRFEDIDGPRVVTGARDRQRADMAALGCVADAETLQSENHARHWELFSRAIDEGILYPCFCSRREILEGLAAIASAPHSAAPIYDGTCRDLKGWPEVKKPTVAWRFRTENFRQDFIVARTGGDRKSLAREFTPGYQWACAIDDYDGDYDLLVRAWDLESATVQQRVIQRWLDPQWLPPGVFHCALVTDDSGHRLEKRSRGVTLAELTGQGISAERLVEIFRRSFKAIPVARGEVSGESARELRLSALFRG